MRYELSNGTMVDDVDGTNVITTSDGNAAVLNEMAGVMLRLLLETQDVDATVMSIVETCDVNEQTVKVDIGELVSNLASNGVLILRDASV